MLTSLLSSTLSISLMHIHDYNITCLIYCLNVFILSKFPIQPVRFKPFEVPVNHIPVDGSNKVVPLGPWQHFSTS